jgi:hypothetical protein
MGHDRGHSTGHHSARYRRYRWWRRARYRTKWWPISPPIMRFCVNILEVPESDLRDYAKQVDRDAVIVRRWNHRRHVIDGLTWVCYGADHRSCGHP